MFRKLSRKKTDALVDALATMGRPFASADEAEAFYAPLRENDRRELKAWSAAFPALHLDLKAMSLKRLEVLYYAIHAEGKAAPLLDRSRLEQLMTTYTREVFVANRIAQWRVMENDFNAGHYTDGLEFVDGGTTNHHYAQDLVKQKENAERDYLFRNFMMYVPTEREAEVM